MFSASRPRPDRVLLFLLLLAFVAAPLLPQAVSRGPEEMTYVGSALWTKAHDIRMVGSVGYAAFENGLVILDLSDLKNPVCLSELYLGGGFRLELRQGLAFVAAGPAGLCLVDVSDPKSPALVGRLELEGEARDVALAGKLAYVAGGPAGVWVVDISRPSSPRTAGNWAAPGEASRVVVRGDTLFLAAGSAGLLTAGLTDPLRPKPSGSLALEGTAEDLALSGDYGYLADGTSGLRVIDLSRAGAPALVATLTASGYCRSVSADGKLLGVGSLYDGGYQLFDLARPEAPHLLSTNKYTMYNEGWNIVLGRGLLAVVDYFSGIFFVDVSSPASVKPIGVYFTPSSIVAAGVRGRYALAVGELSGLQVLDIADPSRPRRVGMTDIFRGVQGLAVSGNRAFVTDRWSVRVFDFSNPGRPVQVKSIRLPAGVPRTIVVREGFAYLTADLAGFYVLDLAAPAGAEVAGRFDFPGFAYGLDVQGDYAYLAHSDMGLQVLDLRDPRHPTAAGSLKLAGEPYGVAVRGSYAYVASGPEGLLVVDVSRPDRPALVSTLPVEDFANGVAVAGGTAYVSDGKAGLKKVDIRDPAAPRLEAIFRTPAECQGVVLGGPFVLAPDSDSLFILK
jgi:hypothetical protein